MEEIDYQQETCQIFNQIQQSDINSEELVTQLIEIFQVENSRFFEHLERCYITIIGRLLNIGRKQQDKFLDFTQELFQKIYERYGINNDRKNAKITRLEVTNLFQHFFQFFCKGLANKAMQIQWFCGTIIFKFLDILTLEENIEELMDTEVAQNLINFTIDLMSQSRKPKVQQLGIKLCSTLQKFVNREDISDEMVQLREKMIFLMCAENNDKIRTLALKNIDITEQTINSVITRVRDKNRQIRAIVYANLNNQNIDLNNFNINIDIIYKLLYDGLCTSDEAVKQQCIKYIQKIYQLNEREGYKTLKAIEEQEEKKVEAIQEKIEEEQVQQATQQEKMVTEQPESQIRQSKGSKSVTRLTQNFKNQRNIYKNFMGTFQISETLLLYPHIYEAIEIMFREFIKFIAEHNDFCDYIKFMLQTVFNVNPSNKNELGEQLQDLDISELMLLRVICQMAYQEEGKNKADIGQQLLSIIENFFPSGVVLAKILQYYGQSGQIMQTLQCLDLAELQINCDESGRSELMNALNNLCNQIPHRELLLPKKGYDVIFNDVYFEIKGSEELEILKVFQSSYEKKVISRSYDLYLNIVKVYSLLEKEQFILKISNIINDIYSPFEGTEEELGLKQEYSKLEQSLKTEQQILLQMQEKLTEHSKISKHGQKNSVNNKELEEQYNKQNQKIEIASIDLKELGAKIVGIQHSAMIFIEGMLTYCKIKTQDMYLENIFQGILLPTLQSTYDKSGVILTAAYKCLVLYCLHFRPIFDKYQGEFFTILSENLNSEKEKATTLCLLKGVCDLYLVHMFQEQQKYQISSYDYFQLILKYAYKGTLRMKEIAICGLFKIFNYTLNQEQLGLSSSAIQSSFEQYKPILIQMMILFIVTYNDTSIQNASVSKISSYVAYFLNYILPQNERSLEIFEKSLEIILALIDSMQSSKQGFNMNHVGWNIYSSLTNFMIIGQEKLMDLYLKHKAHSDQSQSTDSNTKKSLQLIEHYLSFLIRITHKQSYFEVFLKQFLSDIQIIEDFTETKCQIFLKLIKSCEIQKEQDPQLQLNVEILACKNKIELQLSKVAIPKSQPQTGQPDMQMEKTQANTTVTDAATTDFVQEAYDNIYSNYCNTLSEVSNMMKFCIGEKLLENNEQQIKIASQEINRLAQEQIDEDEIQSDISNEDGKGDNEEQADEERKEKIKYEDEEDNEDQNDNLQNDNSEEEKEEEEDKQQEKKSNRGNKKKNVPQTRNKGKQKKKSSKKSSKNNKKAQADKEEKNDIEMDDGFEELQRNLKQKLTKNNIKSEYIEKNDDGDNDQDKAGEDKDDDDDDDIKKEEQEEEKEEEEEEQEQDEKEEEEEEYQQEEEQTKKKNYRKTKNIKKRIKRR